MKVLAQHQEGPVRDDWTHFAVLGDRRTGKTYAGANEVVHQMVTGHRVSVIGPTKHFEQIMIDMVAGITQELGLGLSTRTHDKLVLREFGGSVSLNSSGRGITEDVLWVDDWSAAPLFRAKRVIFTGSWPGQEFPHGGPGVVIQTAPWDFQEFPKQSHQVTAS